jgi:hypothetical protein
MSLINCYYIIDAHDPSEQHDPCEQVSVSDICGLNVKYFQITSVLPKYKLMALHHSHQFLYTILSFNLCDGCEWLREGSCQIKYLKILFST